MIDPFDLIVRNGTLVTSGDRSDMDIGIRGGRFDAIMPRGELRVTAVEELDATGLYVLPGVIDGHVHLREPGLEHEETWLTGTRAAVMGGVTTVLDMPNTLPPTDSTGRAPAKLELARAAAYCDFGLLGLLGPSLESMRAMAGSGLVVGLKVFLGPTTGGLSAPDDDGLRSGLAMARAAGLRVAFHAEDRSIVEASEARVRSTGRTDALAHLESRPVEAEVAAIDRAGRLLRETGASGHLLHLSSAEGLAAVERWQGEGVDLTCEATPHHMFLGRDAYETAGGVARVNPPIRGEPDSLALLDALADGRIDCLASDHAPHLADDKRRGSIWDVPSGIPGVETLLALALTGGVNAGRITLERLACVTSEGPARAWGLWPRKGSVAVGSDADLTIVDLGKTGVVRADYLHGMNNLSPFEGMATRGAAVATIVRGRQVMRDGELVGQPGWGRLVARRIQDGI